MSMNLTFGMALEHDLVISWVVPCGRPQKTASTDAPVGLLDGGEPRQVDEAEVREHLGHRLAGMAVGGQRGDLDGRMGRARRTRSAPV